MPPPLDDLRRTLHDHLVNEVLLRRDPLAPDDDLFEAGLDSMALTRVLVFVEDRFGIRVPDEEIVVDELSTLDRMARFIHARVAHARAARG